MLRLSCNTVPEVYRIAIPKVDIENLSADQHERYQGALKTPLDEEKFYHGRCGFVAIKNIDDLDYLEQGYIDRWSSHCISKPLEDVLDRTCVTKIGDVMVARMREFPNLHLLEVLSTHDALDSKVRDCAGSRLDEIDAGWNKRAKANRAVEHFATRALFLMRWRYFSVANSREFKRR